MTIVRQHKRRTNYGVTDVIRHNRNSDKKSVHSEPTYEQFLHYGGYARDLIESGRTKTETIKKLLEKSSLPDSKVKLSKQVAESLYAGAMERIAFGNKWRRQERKEMKERGIDPDEYFN